MKISNKTIEILVEMILGASKGIEYRSGSQIINFFNDCLNEQKIYPKDFLGSRSEYVNSRIKELNRSNHIKKIIAEALDPVHCNIDHYVEANLSFFNRFLIKDGFEAYFVDNNHRSYVEVSPLIRGRGIEITNELVSSEFIKEQIDKCNCKIIENDLDGAVTNARSLVEAILEALAISLGDENLKYDGNLRGLYTRVSKKLNLHSTKEADMCFKQITSGLTSCIQGFTEITNKGSDRHPRTYKLSRYHAEFVVDSAFTICNFLLGVFENKQIKSQLKTLENPIELEKV